jgi:uncharacterized protein (DUF433 family)
MLLEGVVSNGVIVPDPSADPLPEGTRVQFTLTTGMEPHIRKTPGVCGGDACIGRRRIPVWMLVEGRSLGLSDEQLLADYSPPLTREELNAAWKYAAAHPEEIAKAIRENEEA